MQEETSSLNSALSHNMLKGFLKLDLSKFDRDYLKVNFFFGFLH